ncbi:MAG: hypothetical protein KGI48_11060, partial [Hyphomicrobiales bacterium]|nr:hypothetical protein [Hyphomicrobiales bacterium]
MRAKHARGRANAEQTFMTGVFLHNGGSPEKLLCEFHGCAAVHHLAAAMLIGILGLPRLEAETVIA